MNIERAEEYIKENLNALMKEKEEITGRIVKIEIEIEETDAKIKSMEGEMDKAFEVFAPRKRKNDFAVMEIEKLEEKKNQLKESIENINNRTNVLEREIERLHEIVNVDSNNSVDMCGLDVISKLEDVRGSIARDLHDSVVQGLTSLVHKCEMCSKIVDVDVIRTKLELEVIQKTLRNTIDDIRDTIYDLRPMSFDDLGIEVALERTLNSMFSMTDMKSTINITGEKRDISSVIEITIFRIIQECASNSIKYSCGNNFIVNIVYNEDNLKLDISDDGNGFAEKCEEQIQSEENNHTGMGLDIMRERVSLMSGTMEIDTGAGQGTKIKIVIPI